MFGLTSEEMKLLLGVLDSSWGVLMARGDTDGGNKLASITDKIRRGVIADTQIATALSNAVAYESRNLDESSFETDGEYRWAVGHADGLSDALAIARGKNWKEVIDYEEKENG